MMFAVETNECPRSVWDGTGIADLAFNGGFSKVPIICIEWMGMSHFNTFIQTCAISVNSQAYNVGPSTQPAGFEPDTEDQRGVTR